MKPPKLSWPAKAVKFYLENPQAMDDFISLAKDVKFKNHKKAFGADLLWGHMRWFMKKQELETDKESPYKLNSAYVAYFAHMAEKIEPQIAGLFEHRKLTARNSDEFLEYIKAKRVGDKNFWDYPELNLTSSIQKEAKEYIESYETTLNV